MQNNVSNSSFNEQKPIPPVAVSHITTQNVASDPDEINLLEYVYVLVKHKWWILGAVVLGLIFGYIAAIVKGPTWVAEAVIAPKEAEKSAPQMAGLGALGMMASELGMTGNASLDKIDIVLGSRKFYSEMIENNNMLPMVLKNIMPDEYEALWDETTGDWYGEAEHCKLELGKISSLFIRDFLEKEVEKNNTMVIRVQSKDSLFSYAMASHSVEYLNVHLKEMVENEAEENVKYLEDKLVSVTDPLLREKLQGLIANEFEKAMVVSKEAFQVVDPVYIKKNWKEKQLFPVIFAGGLLFMSLLVIAFFHAIFHTEKSNEDKTYIDAIKKELSFFLPKNR